MFSAPSFLGGKNQMPMAYSPDTGSSPAVAQVESDSAWGDPTIALMGVALRESADRPTLIWNL